MPPDDGGARLLREGLREAEVLERLVHERFPVLVLE
jgi:hypothetical protein